MKVGWVWSNDTGAPPGNGVATFPDDIGAIHTSGFIPASGDATWTVWFYSSGLSTAYQTLYYYGDDPAVYAQSIWIGLPSNFEIIEFYISGPGSLYGPKVPAGFHFLSYVRTGTTHQLYLDGTLIITHTLNIAAWVVTHEFLGTDTFDNFAADPTKMGYFRGWNVAKTVAQIQAERFSDTIVDVTSLWINTPLIDDLLDISGNGRDWGESGGTVTFTLPLPVIPGRFYVLSGDHGLFAPTNWEGGWDSDNGSSSSFISILDPIKDGNTNGTRTRSETSATNPFTVGILRAITRPLAAQTIQGMVDVILGILESNADAQFFWKLYIWVTEGATDVVRGVALDYEDDIVSTYEWPTTSTAIGLPVSQALTPVVAQENDRLVIEFGYISRNAHTTSRTGTIRVGAMTLTTGLTGLSDLEIGSLNTSTEAGSVIFSDPPVLLTVPSNDTFAGATILTVPFTETVDLNAATRDGDEAESCAGGPVSAIGRYSSVWYTWTCPADQTATVSADITDGTFTFDTNLQVLTGTPGAFVEVDCQAATDPSFETITWAATMGVTYIIQVSTLYYFGGTLEFTFTPEVAPSADETILPYAFDIISFDPTNITAMGWILLDTNIVIRHFFYIGNGFTPFTPGEEYVWIGTASDGVTLQMVIYDGATVQTFTGPVLTIGLWYHWAYRKEGDIHTVFLSNEAHNPDVDAVIGPETVPITLVPEAAFIFGADTAIPKAFKLWQATLDQTQMRTEREDYAVVEKTGIYIVDQFRVAVTLATQNYSGYVGNDGTPPIAGPPSWIHVHGPNLDTLPTRPFADTFESYVAGPFDVGILYTPGAVDPAQNYEYGTVPSSNLEAVVLAGVGVGGGQAWSTVGGTATIWFEYDDYDGRCGSFSCFSFKRSDLSEPRGVAAFVGSLPTTNVDFSFGISNDLAAFGVLGNPEDMLFVNFITGSPVIVLIPNIYVEDVYQHIQFFFELSSVNGTLDGIDADGSVTILVDGLVVYEATGLELSADDSRWPEGINTWNSMHWDWGGYMDNVDFGVECYADACPGIIGEPRTGV